MATLITNKYDLPDSIVKAVMIDKHRVMGDISVTQLVDAPQIHHLRRQYDVEEDAMDRIWALMGTAVHHIIESAEFGTSEAGKLMGAYKVLVELGEEKAAEYMEKLARANYPGAFDDDVMLEKTVSITIDGMEISGTFDKFTVSSGVLDDYKNCSVWAFVYEESKKKWFAQQNTYAYILRDHGYTVNEAKIIAIFRDWNASAKVRNKDYPPHPVENIPIKLYDDAFMLDYLKKRVEIHRQAELGNVADCTGKERWAKADSWAINKKGGKRAVRVFDKEQFADAFIKSDGYKYEGLSKEHRPGEDGRCDKWCPVRHVCPQRKAKADQLAESNTE